MTNQSLVHALVRLLDDSNFVLSQLSENDYLDTVSQCLVDTLTELRQLLPDAVDQFDI